MRRNLTSHVSIRQPTERKKNIVKSMYFFFNYLKLLTVMNTTRYGVHGYDNAESDMHAIFMAKGPIFNKGKTIKPVQTINLYNLFCYILEIECNSKTNGSNSLEIWNDLLTKPFSPTSDNSTNRQKGKFRQFYELIHDRLRYFTTFHG